MLQVDSVNLLRQRLGDLLLDPEIIDDIYQRSFFCIADRMDGVFEANVALRNDAQFESALQCQTANYCGHAAG